MVTQLVVDGHVYNLYADPNLLTIHNHLDEYVGEIVLDDNMETAYVNTENSSEALNYFEAREMTLHQSVQLVINVDLG